MSTGEKSSNIEKIIAVAAIAVAIITLAVIAVLLLGSCAAFTSPEPEATAPPAAPEAVVLVGVIPTPEAGAPSVTADVSVNIRSGPGENYPRIGILSQGLSAKVVGVSPDRAWWVINYPLASNGQGWVAAQLVTAQNAENVPVVQLPPVPPPTAAPPVAISGWLGEYFDNRDLQGDPVLVRDDPEINFDWANGSPDPSLPADNFSARWTIDEELPAGTYRFSIWTDDGVRMWVDDVLVIDDWREGSARNVSADVNLTRGTHTGRVEYFEAFFTALVQLETSYIDQFPDWKAEYFDNDKLQGDPVVLRNEVDLNYNWGTASPAPGVPRDNFSARWTLRDFMEEGTYLVWLEVEGGVRVWLDGVLLIDSWQSQGLRTLEAQTGNISRGDHDWRVEYFKTTGNGRLLTSATLIGVDGPPKAGINGPSEARVGQLVGFDARKSRVAPGSHIDHFLWDFGDGVADSGVDVAHIYTQPGLYEVRLTVIDDKARSHTTKHLITVTGAAIPEGRPPAAVITAPSEGIVGETIALGAGDSQSESPIVSYAWQFGDGTTANAVVVNKVYNAPGVYNVILTLTDDRGLQGSTNKQITIRDPEQPTPEPTPTIPGLPQPVINFPTEGVVGQPVTFDGSQSQPGSNPIASYQWDFGDGTTASGAVVDKVYDAEGTYNVTLTVTDNAGFGNDGGPVQITILEAQQPTPEPTPIIPALPQPVINFPVEGMVGQPVTFDGSESQPGSNPIASYEWDLGDGTTASGAVVVKVYDAAGTYQVTLTVTDEAGFGNVGGPVQITITEAEQETPEPVATPLPVEEETPEPAEEPTPGS